MRTRRWPKRLFVSCKLSLSAFRLRVFFALSVGVGLTDHVHCRAKKYHPDKIAPEEAHNDTFIHLRAALSVISDPDLRRVYNRYGPSALDCTGDCRVDHNHISRALVQQQSCYIAWAVKSVIFAFRGNWHWALCLAVPIAALATVEAHAVLENPVLGLVPGAFNTLMELTRLRQPYLPFEMVTLLRSVLNASLFALAQLRMMHKYC